MKIISSLATALTRNSVATQRLHFLGSTSRLSMRAPYSVTHGSRAPPQTLNLLRLQPRPAKSFNAQTGAKSRRCIASTSGAAGTNDPPFFETEMPWYFRNWVWLVVGLDVAWVIFEIDSMLNHFVDKVPQEDGTVKFQLKPLWQRAGAAALVAMGGLTFGAGILLTRSRNVRLIRLHKNSKQVYIETASNRPGKGLLINKEDCVISPNRSDDFVDMVVNGSRGRYPLRLKGASVDGEAGDLLDIRKRLLDKWYKRSR